MLTCLHLLIEQLERFNGLYLNKLENRMLTSATSLAHIDSNVKNIQERAHVWDTFQLHVSAWNEQIKSLDKKLDILSRCGAFLPSPCASHHLRFNWKKRRIPWP